MSPPWVPTPWPDVLGQGDVPGFASGRLPGDVPCPLALPSGGANIKIKMHATMHHILDPTYK